MTKLTINTIHPIQTTMQNLLWVMIVVIFALIE